MTPAPKTPDTIKRVRTLAVVRQAADIAAEIGWELPRLERLAQEQGITLLAPKPTGVDFKANIEFRRYPPRMAGAICGKVWALTADMSVTDIIASLPPKQSALFEFLSRDIDGDNHSAESIAARIGSERTSVTKLASRIEHKLRVGKTRWRLQSAMGIGGGYRLVTVEVPS